jgi:hypothetical protein
VTAAEVRAEVDRIDLEPLRDQMFVVAVVCAAGPLTPGSRAEVRRLLPPAPVAA